MRSEEIARSLSKRTKKRKAAAAVFAVIFCLFAMLSLLRGQGDHDNRSLNHGRRDSKLSRRSDFQRAWSFSCVMVLHAEAVSANILHGKAVRFFRNMTEWQHNSSKNILTRFIKIDRMDI